MIIRTVDEMIQDIQQNIYRLDIAIGSANRNYALGELKRIEYRHLLMRYNSEKFAYEHCLEMAEALQHSQNMSQATQDFGVSIVN